MKRALEKQLIIICAGTGCGKSRAAFDFTCGSKSAVLWVQLVEQDNMPARFWDNYIHAIEQFDGPYVDDLKKLGFPDIEDKFIQYMDIQEKAMLKLHACLGVFDDFHLIHNPDVTRFIEKIVPSRRFQFILIGREFPRMNLADMINRGNAFIIQEDSLNFTEIELSLYLQQQGLSVGPKVLHDIFEDTEGWAFAVNLSVRSLKKSPGYAGYTRNAIKKNIFEQMESIVWNVASESLKRFEVCLSLIEHLSADLLETLAEGDENLLAEFRENNTFIRYDSNIDAYLIHHLFLDFLRSKQELLTDDDKRKTYRAVAVWCKNNGFIVDALNYYEKLGDYHSIAFLIFDSFGYISNQLASHALDIFERAPATASGQVELFAAMHLYMVERLGRWEDYFILAERYEKKYLRLPEDDVFRNRALGAVYCGMAMVRYFLCTADNHYDFDEVFAKMAECQRHVPMSQRKVPMDLRQMRNINYGAWCSTVGSAKRGRRRGS